MNMWRRMGLAGGYSIYLWNGNLDMDSIMWAVGCLVATFDPWSDIGDSVSHVQGQSPRPKRVVGWIGHGGWWIADCYGRMPGLESLTK